LNDAEGNFLSILDGVANFNHVFWGDPSWDFKNIDLNGRILFFERWVE